MFGKFKLFFATIAAAAAGVFGTLQHQAGKVDAAVDQWRTEHLAAFSPACPYIKTNAADYKRAWDRKYPYGDVLLYAFSENQRQYFPELTPELAKQCFTAPVNAS